MQCADLALIQPQPLEFRALIYPDLADLVRFRFGRTTWAGGFEITFMIRHIRYLLLFEFHIKEIIHQLIQVPHLANLEVNASASITHIHLFVCVVDFGQGCISAAWTNSCFDLFLHG